MNDEKLRKWNTYLDIATDIRTCIVMSSVSVVIILFLILGGSQPAVGLILVRVFYSIIFLVVALLTLAEKKQSLFLVCVIWGVMCFFLSNMFSACSYVWFGNDSAFHLIEMLSDVGFLLFLFTASFGALDSLDDDGTVTYRKYRVAGVVALLAVTTIWGICFIRVRNIMIIPIGGSLSLTAYIVVKHIIIPNINGGFIKHLRPYNVVVFLVLVIMLSILTLMGYEEMMLAVTVLKTLCATAAIWIVPMAKKGVSKWGQL